MEFIMRPIGVIHSPFTGKEGTPIQPSRSRAIGTADVAPEFAAGLKDIDGFSHIILLHTFHASSGYSLLVKPFLDDPEHSLFATRHPYRPNALGLSIVKLLSHRDSSLPVEGIDVFNRTSLNDMRAHVAEFDVRTDTRAGRHQTRSRR